MVLYDYSKDGNPHPGGFKGIRVVVSVDGEIRQKHFTASETEKAKQWEEKQLKAQAAAQRKRARLRNTVSNKNPITSTGVKGLRIGLKAPSGREKGYRCVIAVSVTSLRENRRVGHKYVVTKATLDSVWYKACKTLAYHLDRNSIPAQWLDKRPDPNDFKPMIEDWTKKNWPRDPGFDSLPESVYPSHLWSS